MSYKNLLYLFSKNPSVSVKERRMVYRRAETTDQIDKGQFESEATKKEGREAFRYVKELFEKRQKDIIKGMGNFKTNAPYCPTSGYESPEKAKTLLETQMDINIFREQFVKKFGNETEKQIAAQYVGINLAKSFITKAPAELIKAFQEGQLGEFEFTSIPETEKITFKTIVEEKEITFEFGLDNSSILETIKNERSYIIASAVNARKKLESEEAQNTGIQAIDDAMRKQFENENFSLEPLPEGEGEEKYKTLKSPSLYYKIGDSGFLLAQDKKNPYSFHLAKDDKTVVTANMRISDLFNTKEFAEIKKTMIANAPTNETKSEEVKSLIAEGKEKAKALKDAGKITYTEYQDLTTAADEATKTAELLDQKNQNRDKKTEEIDKKYEQAMTQIYEFDPETAGQLYEGSIAKNWEHLEGARAVSKMLEKAPFSMNQETIGRFMSKALSEDLNTRIYFEDLYNMLLEAEGFDKIKTKFENQLLAFTEEERELFGYSKRASRIMEGKTWIFGKKPYRFFQEIYSNLKDRESKGQLTDKEKSLKRFLLTNLLAPCTEVLEAVTQIKHPDYTPVIFGKGDRLLTDQTEGYTGKSIIETYYENPQNKEMIKNLRKFSESTELSGLRIWYRRKKSGLFREAISERIITIADEFGGTTVVDEGLLRRNFQPDAVLMDIFNSKENYEIGKNGEKTLKKEKITEYINQKIRKGYATLKLRDPEITAPIETFLISDIEKSELSEDQIAAFQAGYIVEHSEEFKAQIEELKESKEVPKSLQAVIDELRKEGATDEDIEKFKSKVIVGLYLGFRFKDNTLSTEIAGIGSGIKINDDLTILFGAGIDLRENQPIGTVGLKVNIQKSGKLQSSIAIGFKSPNSVGIGAGTEWEWGNSGLTSGIGGGFLLDWSKGQVDAGAGLELLSWSEYTNSITNQRVQEVSAEKTAETMGLTPEIVACWETLSKEEQIEIIQNTPSLQEKLAVIKKDNLAMQETLTDEAIIEMVSLIKSQYSAEEIGKLHWEDFLIIRGFGVGIDTKGNVGAGVIVKLFRTITFVPRQNPNNKLLRSQSAKIGESKILMDLSKLEFVENTGNLYYNPESELGIGYIQKSETIDLSSLANDIETKNAKLRAIEMRLNQTDNYHAELIIDNSDDKDIEVHVDPAIADTLGVVLSENKLFLTGNYNDLIIQRERVKFPRMREHGHSSIQDIITIRQKRSVLGMRDRQTIQNIEGACIIKKAGNKYRIEKSANYNAGQTNITENKAFAGKFKKEDLPEEIQTLIEKNPDENLTLTPAQAKNIQERQQQRIEAANEGQEKYESQGIRSTLETDLEKLYKKPGFREKIGNAAESDFAIIQIIKEEGAKYSDLALTGLNGKETTHAVEWMLERWYSKVNTLDPEQYAKLNEKQRISVNKDILQRLKNRKEYSRKLFEKRFAEVVPTIGVSSSANAMAIKMMDDAYKPVIDALTQNPSLDFVNEFQGNNGGLEEFDVFISATRTAKSQPVLSRTISYSPISNDFLKDSIHKYKIKEPGIEGDLARTLLEMASPTNKDGLELLRSPLAQKIIMTQAYDLLAGEKLSIAMTEIVKNPSLAGSAASGDYAEAMTHLKTLLSEIRSAQIKGEPFIGEAKDHPGIKIIIDLNKVKVASGAFTKCANGSAAVSESGSIEISGPGVHVTENVLVMKFTGDTSSAEVAGAIAASVYAPGESEDHLKEGVSKAEGTKPGRTDEDEFGKLDNGNKGTVGKN